MRPIYTIIILLIFCGWIAPDTVTAQEKVASESKRDQRKRAETDPWAEFEDEVDSIPRWDFGINIGAYFPSKYSAKFYNGTPYPPNINNVEYVFSNKYWYEDIKYLLNSDDTVLIVGYPADMRYQVAFTGGLFVRFNFNRKNGIFLEANYTQLKAENAFTVQVDPQSYLTPPDYRDLPIIGKEYRVLLDLGYQRSFPFESKIYIFFQGGAIMSYTRVLQSFFIVEGKEYNMVNIYGSQGYIPNTNSQTYNIIQSAIGFGTYFGLGAGFPLTDMFGIEPGFSIQYYPTNLEGYSLWKGNFSLYMRILLGAGKTHE